jgi:hypothetical protein
MSWRTVRKALLYIAAALSSIAIAGAIAVYQLAASSCGNSVLAEAMSPDGKMKAVVFERDCGATTDFSTQVSVIRATSALGSSSGNIFSADTNHGAAPSGPGGGPMVSVRWLSPQMLLVARDAAARVFEAESKSGEVEVRYESTYNAVGG